jgi:hypothetical protein
MFAAVRDLAAGHGRDPDDLQLVVRANIKVTPEPLGRDRPAYWGSVDQVAADLDDTRATGADEIILDLQSNARSADELLDLATSVTAPLLTPV